MRNPTTWTIKPYSTGYMIDSNDPMRSAVLARRPRGPSLIDPVPPRIFPSVAKARAFMAKYGMIDGADHD